jgi:hypothetical protein
MPGTRKRGPYLYQQSRYGLISRARFVPTDPRTAAQLRVRRFLVHLASRWRALTLAEQYAWSLAAWQQPCRVRAGRTRFLTGFNVFFRMNSTLLLIGAPEVTVPPPKPVFDPLPVTGLTITNNGGPIVLKLAASSPPAAGTMLWATPPCSQGRDIARRWSFLGTVISPVGGEIDITAPYVAWFGLPPVASKVFVRVNQTFAGWQDTPCQWAAIVPAGVAVPKAANGGRQERKGLMRMVC